MDEGLVSNPFSKEGMKVYTDADWAGSYALDGSAASRTGVVIYIQDMPVAWVSTKQKSIALSTAQAELHALSTGVQHGLHAWYIAQELGLEVGERLQTYVDASAAISFALKIGSKTKMKHLDIRKAWIQQLRDRKLVDINKVDTKDQKADALTKIMGKVEYQRPSQFLQNVLDLPHDLD